MCSRLILNLAVLRKEMCTCVGGGRCCHSDQAWPSNALCAAFLPLKLFVSEADVECCVAQRLGASPIQHQAAQ